MPALEITLSHILTVVVLIFTVFQWVVSLFIAIILWYVRKNEKEQDDAIKDLREQLSKYRAELTDFVSNAGNTRTSIDAVHEELRQHVMREETIFWKDVKTDREAQRIFAEAVLQRVTSLEAKITSVEAKMPNGELQKLALDMAKLVTTVETAIDKAVSAEEHIRQHDSESQEWKRRIMSLEAIIERRKRV